MINKELINLPIEELKNLVGKKVKKTTHKKFGAGNPFKSGNMENTIKNVVEHPTLKIPAFTFLEDDSFVEARRCILID